MTRELLLLGSSSEIFLLARYVPQVEREQLAQEFLSLRQDGESVMVITRMFTERAMFCAEFTSE